MTATLAQPWPDAIVLSARDATDVADLRTRLAAFFERGMVEGEVRVPYDRRQRRGEIETPAKLPVASLMVHQAPRI